ncbi:MAG: hypothetical protein NTU94_17410 [Planctomycetota bacterium]|nr:hypothetical protein [Planctomycetota bacterium]
MVTCHGCYDGLHRRIARIVKDGDNWDRTDYHYSESWPVLEERFADDVSTQNKGTPATAVSVQWLWDIRYVDSPVLRWRDADADPQTGDYGLEETLSYCNDANMNVTALVDAETGEVVERYMYDPYGKATVYEEDWTPRQGNASAYSNEILFAGYRFDSETGLYSSGDQVYHPTLGRGLQRSAPPDVQTADLYADALDRLPPPATAASECGGPAPEPQNDSDWWASAWAQAVAIQQFLDKYAEINRAAEVDWRNPPPNDPPPDCGCGGLCGGACGCPCCAPNNPPGLGQRLDLAELERLINTMAEADLIAAVLLVNLVQDMLQPQVLVPAVKQGGLNALQGLQNAAIGILNMALFLSRNQAFGGMLPYTETIHSPQWAQGKYVDVPDPWQKVSEIAGGEALMAALTLAWVEGVEAVRGVRALAAYPSGQPQVVRAGQAVRNYLGEDLIVKRADTEGFVAISKDGTRRFRMDYTGHGAPPHGHVEVLNPKGRWVDAGPEHQYQFKNTGD